jgi:hypothetical protein
MGKKSGFGSGMNNQDHISESLETIFWGKMLKFLKATLLLSHAKRRYLQTVLFCGYPPLLNITVKENFIIFLKVWEKQFTNETKLELPTYTKCIRTKKELHDRDLKRKRPNLLLA